MRWQERFHEWKINVLPAQFYCIHLTAPGHTSKRHSWRKQCALFHTKEKDYISVISTKRAQKCECCHDDSSVFKNIYSLEIFVPGALSGKLASVRVNTHTYTQAHSSFFPLSKKWIMAVDYEDGNSTNSHRVSQATARSTVKTHEITL